MRWDPRQYGRYADERGRPFLDLVAQIDAGAPRRVVDLGCGPGTLTALLAQRWPHAAIEGVDSSPEMIAAAQTRATDRLTFTLGDVVARVVDADVVVSNATLQWVPQHRELVARWAAVLPPGGWLAFQVPGNFEAPSHTLIRAVAREFGVEAATLHEDTVAEPGQYADVLRDAGLTAQAWETTYVHLLPGPDPVLDWLRGTALRPVLAALSPADAEDLTRRLAERLRAAYPAGRHGTAFPFRRMFAVGHRP